MNANIKRVESKPPDGRVYGRYLYLWDMTPEEREKRMNQIRSELRTNARNEGQDE